MTEGFGRKGPYWKNSKRTDTPTIFPSGKMKTDPNPKLWTRTTKKSHVDPTNSSSHAWCTKKGLWPHSLVSSTAVGCHVCRAGSSQRPPSPSNYYVHVRANGLTVVQRNIQLNVGKDCSLRALELVPGSGSWRHEASFSRPNRQHRYTSVRSMGRTLKEEDGETVKTTVESSILLELQPVLATNQSNYK